MHQYNDLVHTAIRLLHSEVFYRKTPKMKTAVVS